MTTILLQGQEYILCCYNIVTMERQQFKHSGYGVVEKVAANGGNSARVFVPKTWTGKKVVVILLEPLDDEKK